MSTITGPVCPFARFAPAAKPAPEGPGGAEETPAPAPQDGIDPAGLGAKLHDARGSVIPCPWWRTMINTDHVHVKPDGNVSTKEIAKGLKDTGVGFFLREGAMFGIKKVACELAGKSTGGITGFMHILAQKELNVLDLPKSSLMHTGDSGTLRDGFHPANLEQLLSYSSDGKIVTEKDLAAANKHQVEASPGESGHKFGVAEYSIFLNVFGKTDESGHKYISKEDATRVFKENEFPEGWHKPHVGFVSLGKTIMGMFKDQK